jgi:hypothetical protein
VKKIFLPFHDRHMHRLNIAVMTFKLRKLRLQPRQRRAKLLQLGF